MFDLCLWNMPSDSVSYNPTLFEADGGPYDSRKLQNGRLKHRSKKKERKEGGGTARMAKTLFGFLSIAPTSAPAPHGIKQGGGFGRVNHFLQVVNSQGRPNESDVCVQIKWRHRSNTLPKRPTSPLSHSSWKLNNAGLWSPDKADLLHSLWLLLLTELNQTVNFADVNPFEKNIWSVMQFEGSNRMFLFVYTAKFASVQTKCEWASILTSFALLAVKVMKSELIALA